MDVLRGRFGAEDTLFHDEAALAYAMDEANSLLQGWHEEGLGIHSILDDSYPVQLRDIHQAPPVLFSQGELTRDDRAIAVVGTRKPTDRGIQMAQRIATTLAESDVTVVSGLAAGIDTAARRDWY